VTLKKTIELNDTKNEAFRSQERGIFCSAPVLLDFFAIQGTCKASKEEWVLVSNGPVQALRTLRVPRAVPTGSRPQGSGGAAVPTQARRVFLTGRERSASTGGLHVQSARRCVLAQGNSVAASPAPGPVCAAAAALYAPTGVGFRQWHTLAHQKKLSLHACPLFADGDYIHRDVLD